MPILYISADATGVPMRKEELEGRAGKQADGSAKTRMAYLGCVFSQHQRDEKGHPMRDYESTTYVSGLVPLNEFGPCLRQEATFRQYGEFVGHEFFLTRSELMEQLDDYREAGFASLEIVGIRQRGRYLSPGAVAVVLDQESWHPPSALSNAGRPLAKQLAGKQQRGLATVFSRCKPLPTLHQGLGM